MLLSNRPVISGLIDPGSRRYAVEPLAILRVARALHTNDNCASACANRSEGICGRFAKINGKLTPQKGLACIRCIPIDIVLEPLLIEAGLEPSRSNDTHTNQCVGQVMFDNDHMCHDSDFVGSAWVKRAANRLLRLI
jgi:hypothetical protein